MPRPCPVVVMTTVEAWTSSPNADLIRRESPGFPGALLLQSVDAVTIVRCPRHVEVRLGSNRIGRNACSRP